MIFVTIQLKTQFNIFTLSEGETRKLYERQL